MLGLALPWCGVRDDFVEVSDGHGVLGFRLVVADAGVLEPVAPQNLVRQVGGAHLAAGPIKSKLMELHLFCFAFVD